MTEGYEILDELVTRYPSSSRKIYEIQINRDDFAGVISDLSSIRGESSAIHLMDITHSNNERSTLAYLFFLPDYSEFDLLRILVSIQGTSHSSIIPYFPNAYFMEHEVSSQHAINFNYDDLSGMPDFMSIIHSISIQPAELLSKPFHFTFHIEDTIIKELKLNFAFTYSKIEAYYLQNDWRKVVQMIPRVCSYCCNAHQLAYILAIENMAGITDKIPQRASWLRILVCELERIANHIMLLGFIADNFDFTDTHHLLMQSLKIHREVMNLQSKIKKNGDFIIPGGIAHDLDDLGAVKKEFADTVQSLATYIQEYKTQDWFTGSISPDLLGLGTIENSHLSGALGALGRSMGDSMDLRIVRSYSRYDELPLKAVSTSTFTIRDGLKVYLGELEQSIHLGDHILGNLQNISPELLLNVGTIDLQDGEVISMVEAPSGPLLYHIVCNDNSISELRIKNPSVTNIVPTLSRLIGLPLPMAPVLIKFIEMGYDALDDVVIVDLLQTLDNTLHRSDIKQLMHHYLRKN